MATLILTVIGDDLMVDVELSFARDIGMGGRASLLTGPASRRAQIARIQPPEEALDRGSPVPEQEQGSAGVVLAGS